MGNRKITILIDKKEKITSIVTIPPDYKPGSGKCIIVAHGAGNDMNNPLIVAFCEGMAAAGFLAVRFNFPYKEKGKKAPDSPKKLEATWQAVFEYIKSQPEFSPAEIIGAGKSMGGRIASQMIAAGTLPVSRFIFLGYPLHPPGQKDKIRDAHLYEIRIPLLFFAGTRDALCSLDLLKKVLKKLQIPWDLEIIEGGDHSFNVLKSSTLTVPQVYDHIVKKSVKWLA
jgi:predicted alpha/beta-hydrolase family hydrolase